MFQFCFKQSFISESLQVYAQEQTLNCCVVGKFVDMKRNTLRFLRVDTKLLIGLKRTVIK